jgi:hypothetical protein
MVRHGACLPINRMTNREPQDRLPLPSEDEGDLVQEPPQGTSDDYLVSEQGGVPYVPPMERVLNESPAKGGPDTAAAATDAGEELRREGSPDDPTQDLGARAVEALRRSELPAGDRVRISVVGSTVHLRGEVESIDIADEIAALIEDLPGVDEVVDETTIPAATDPE